MTSIEIKANLPVLKFDDELAMGRWIQDNSEATGVWIKFPNKASGIVSLGRSQALDLALCHGWIDGQADKYDADYYVMRFTPRRRGSPWSQINRGRVERLEADGRMQPSGRQQVDAAKAAGRWESAYPPPSDTRIPDDIAAALAANGAALKSFEALSKTKRYALLHAIATVKKPETRVRKIQLLMIVLTHKPS